MPDPRRPLEVAGMEVVGYSGVGGRPPFKLAVWRDGERWFLACGHLWHRGWSILDVTDPRSPRPVSWLEGPADTWTCQVNVADGLLVGGMASISPKWGGRPGAPFEEAAQVWDIRDPEAPRLRSQIRLGGTGSHRNFWAGGRYLHLAANAAGFHHYLYVVMDLADPDRPVEVSRWWLEGQGPGETVPPGEDGLSLHGPAYVVSDRAYLSYGGGGMVILDITDITHPSPVSRWRPSPPFKGGFFGAGVHTARPLIRRDLAVVHGEAGAEGCAEPLNLAGIVDISDPAAPWLVSTFPIPTPGAGLGYSSYCDKGGRFGPHNSHLPQGHPDLDDDEDTVYLTWFCGGLRVYDIRDARTPREIAHFVPPDPAVRHGPLPASGLVAQSEDVIVDARGIIYVTEKNGGVHLLRMS